ncbi:hypothetical protein PAXRUDRAFT_826513 [Paxillus rubicundulus Ve08.2h10]|uniref:Uncharacterized protein n=1 Tax=Paxillus rubicundulus Ve08.2h10 TaxID=930991 RepID=A0A0D0DZI9_9AGAM|nr:hypothetical protein PAXRUDRAFT_826513 [Paxillus rubicundulus Ve08.2h10]
MLIANCIADRKDDITPSELHVRTSGKSFVYIPLDVEAWVRLLAIAVLMTMAC